jgi:hypothetical protein
LKSGGGWQFSKLNWPFPSWRKVGYYCGKGISKRTLINKECVMALAYYQKVIERWIDG